MHTEIFGFLLQIGSFHSQTPLHFETSEDEAKMQMGCLGYSLLMAWFHLLQLQICWLASAEPCCFHGRLNQPDMVTSWTEESSGMYTTSTFPSCRQGGEGLL
jgi:hypothetical protein